MTVGQTIRRRRLELAAILQVFNALAFARRLGITVGHLYHVETGRVGASAELLDRVASLIGLDAHRLLAANGQIAPSLEAALILIHRSFIQRHVQKPKRNTVAVNAKRPLMLAMSM